MKHNDGKETDIRMKHNDEKETDIRMSAEKSKERSIEKSIEKGKEKGKETNTEKNTDYRKKSHEMDMLNGSLALKMLIFAMPLAASSILQQLFNSADVAVAGRFAGSDALAAVGSNAAVVALFVNVFVGLSVGVTPLMNPFARVVTMLTMFIGRVGPVSLAISLSARKDSAAARRAVQPQAHINVG